MQMGGTEADPNAGFVAYGVNLVKAATGRKTAVGARIKSKVTRRKRVTILGDSFVMGAGATSRRRNGYAYLLGHHISAVVAPLGSGGTGFILGCGQGTHYQGRLRHLVLTRPHVAVIQASANDLHLTDAEIFTAVTDFFMIAQHALKQTRFVLVGPIWTANAEELARIRAVIERAAAHLEVQYINPTGWITAETAGHLLAPDRIHPSDLGHAIINERITEPIRCLLSSPAST